MSKELEALLDLKKEALKDIDFSPHTIDELDIREKRIKTNEKIIKNYNIVETTLKEYETLVEVHSITINAMKPIEEKLKALEIITEKRVNVHLLLLSDRLEQYNFKILPYRKLTKEEYDLLKEVLL